MGMLKDCLAIQDVRKGSPQRVGLRMKLRNIVVGVDFSDLSKEALERACQLARESRAKLRLVHVVDRTVAAGMAEWEECDVDDVRSRLTDQAHTALEELGKSADTPLPTLSRVLFGDPVEELIHQIKQVNAELLVIGVRGVLADVMGAGAQAARLVRQAPCDVYLHAGGAGKSIRKILVAIDFSEVSRTVVKHAVSVARAHQAELHLLHVDVAPWGKLLFGPEQGGANFPQDSRTATLEERLRGFIEDKYEGQVHYHLIESPHAGKTISQVVGQVEADLLVLGTRDPGSLKYLFLGSTAEHVLMERPCSLLAVRPDAED